MNTKPIPQPIRWTDMTLHPRVVHVPARSAEQYANGVACRSASIATLTQPIQGLRYAVYATDGRACDYRGYPTASAAKRAANAFLRGKVDLPVHKSALQGDCWIQQ